MPQLLPRPAVTGMAVGMRTEGEVRRNVAGFTAPVPPGLWTDLSGEGLLHERTLLPPAG
jgi:D-threo-aldose 1-dehydrogenase